MSRRWVQALLAGTLATAALTGPAAADRAGGDPTVADPPASASRAGAQADVAAGAVATSPDPARPETAPPDSSPARTHPVAVRDGATSATAAASCWAVKQTRPTAADGRYWLLTPRLVRPQQFWCDMTTDGGGWVLIGRGRQGWSWRNRGQGNAGNVAAIPDGPAAFAVQYYPSGTVDALLDGGRPDTLPDGVRVRRAADDAGTAWQEIRYTLRDQARWSWAFGAGLPVTAVRVGAVTVHPAGTADTAPQTADDAQRVFTFDWPVRGVPGAGFAAGRTGSAGRADTGPASGYRWTAGHEGHPVPFAQVYLRPRLGNGVPAGDPIPDQGLPATTVPRRLSSMSEPLSGWGVTGSDSPTDQADALALAEVGDRIYVGGTFQAVQRGPAGVPVRQRYLAAFDRRTGAFLPGFAPTLDGAVLALTTTAQGRLIVGGRFGTVDGARHPGLVSLDPATGTVDPTWTAVPSAAPDAVTINALTTSDGWVYVGGRFASISGGSGLLSRRITAGRLARVSATTGRPDPGFAPRPSGEPTALAGSVRGDRLYVGGDLRAVNGTPSPGLAVLDPATGATLAGLAEVLPIGGPASAGATAGAGHPVLESADGRRVLAAAGGHDLQLLDSTDLTRVAAQVTLGGGGFQTVAQSDGVIYATCRCFAWDVRHDDSHESGPGSAGDGRIGSINGIGAYDAATLEQLDDFEPSWRGAAGGDVGGGLRASLVDSAGCVWFAGDVVQASLGRGAGGVVAFCPRDADAPLAPEALVVTGRPVARLSWSGGADASGPVGFEVLRDDRVVAAPTTRSWTDVAAWPGARYAVRSVDSAGNRSATTPVAAFTP